jgi:hypothetical protein
MREGSVMAGLAPAIHAGRAAEVPTTEQTRAEKCVGVWKPSCSVTAWIPGTRPGMTRMAIATNRHSARKIWTLYYLAATSVGLSA